ncbi:MAG: prepilin-type N-terminal cleavage/methylation domain-containing protein [Bacilli bacterium]|nr:prepilin-type N-terminal cleavage/methylation domain-containing protein [Bacilli bacterium]
MVNDMKKGFTLVELLGVIVILGIIGVITVPLIISVVNDSKDNANDIQEETIRRAAKNYIQSHVYTLPEECETESGCTLTIKQLKDAGYLEEKDLKNSKTDEVIADDITVKVFKSNNKYKYEYPVK